MSSGRRRSLKTSTIIKILIGITVLAIVLIAGMSILRKKVDQTMKSDDDNEVKTAEVTTGSISTTVTGSGTLSYADVEDLTLPAKVEIEKYYVSAGDTVEAGTLLASVNTTSLVTAMSDVQQEIADLDEDLAEAEDEQVSDTITATVSGRVKKIYAAEDDNVANVMYENNALILLSLDDKMALDIETDALAAGDTVEVTTGDETYTGTVENIISNTATITLTDNGPAYGEEAVVSRDETEIGTGRLYIHRALSVTGYAGTVEAVKVSENEEVSAGDTLFTLTDTSYTANYDSLLAQREELEEELENLVRVYKEGAVYAKEAGTLTSLTKGVVPSDSSNSANAAASASMSGSFMGTAGTTAGASSGNTSEGTDTVFSISPDTTMNVTVDIDESNILSLSIGQSAAVTVTSLGDETFSGTVTEISNSGTSSNGVTTYSCVVSIPKQSSMLSGMTADTSIVIEGTDNALLVPVDAVNQTRASAYVYTSYDEETGTLGDMVEVTVGITNSQYAEITGGLAEGTTVYYLEESSGSDAFGGFGGMGGFSGGDFSGGGSNGGFNGMPGGSSSGGFTGMPGGGSGGSSGGFPGMPGGQ